MKTVFILLFILLTISKSSISEIIYSGLTLQGKFSDNEINYKYFYPFYINNKKEINKNLFQIFKNKKNIVAKKSSNKSALVLSSSIAADDVAIYDYGKGFRTYIITFFPEVSIFDSSTKEIIHSMSAMATATHTTGKELSIADLYKEIYLNNLKINLTDSCSSNKIIEVNIYQIFENLYDCIDIHNKPKNNLQINVRFDSKLKKQFPNLFSDKLSEQASINSVAYRVTSLLSSNSAIEQILVIPHSKDQKITGVMKRFSDTTQISIKLPTPDFVIDTQLIGFQRKLKNEDYDQIHSLYASGATIKILEPLSGTILFDSKFKNLWENYEPISMKNLNENQELSLFYRTLTRLYNEAFTNIFSETPNKKYFDKYSYTEFKKVKQMHKSLKKAL
jgi:hypothetical protein